MPSLLGGFMSDQSVPGAGQLATVGKRVVARIIDAIIMVPIALILFGGFVSRSINGDGDIGTGAAFVGGLVGVAIGGIYEVFMTANGGQTLGKKVMKIKIVRLADGQTPDMNTAVKRWLPNVVGLVPKIGSPLSALIGVASLVLVFTDSRRQSVNDKFAQTVVVEA